MEQFISFPGLGWEFPIKDTIFKFSLFNHEFSIKWYGLLIVLGIFLALVYTMKRAKDFEVDADRYLDVVIVSIIAAMLGARFYYAVFSDDPATLLSPAKFFAVWEGGLAIYGGIVFAFLAALVLCRVRKVNTLSVFDMAGLGFLIGQSIGRWGNFVNQEAYGGLTDVLWRMSGSRIMNNEDLFPYGAELTEGVHPTFLYESLWCVLGFILLHIISKKRYRFKGQIFSMYLMWYGLGRFFIEMMRSDSLYFGAIKVSVLVSGAAVIGGFIIFTVLRGREMRVPVDLFSEPISEIVPDDAGEESGNGEDGMTDESEETGGDLVDRLIDENEDADPEVVVSSDVLDDKQE